MTTITTIFHIINLVAYLVCLIISLIMRYRQKDNNAIWYLVFSLMFLIQMYNI